jgi:hypothetical protein
VVGEQDADVHEVTQSTTNRSALSMSIL